jgi:hypothetical protein
MECGSGVVWSGWVRKGDNEDDVSDCVSVHVYMIDCMVE